MSNARPTSGVTLRQLAERVEHVFSPYPQANRYFPAGAIEQARQRLCRALERGDGPGLVIGGPGTGKSLLLQVLAAQYQQRFDVVLLACARLCTRRALLQAMLFELGLPYRSRDEGELRLTLLDRLLSSKECPSGLLLLVDEAQALPVPLLDELRVMTNLIRGGVPRLRLVLAGSSALEESFAHPVLESFSQRLSARCYLAPFNRDETMQFIRAQVGACGGIPEEIFASDAWNAVFEATDGVPRLVNQLCDRALMLAAADHRQCIDRESIERAWADLQQLPTPWETPPCTVDEQPTPRVIEFVGLDEAEPELGNDADIEPTELDWDEPGDARQDHVSADETAEHQEAINPFAEPFDEEEVVLDTFAAWENVFGRTTPQVQNRRDPGFANLVEAAIVCANGCEEQPSGCSRVAPLQSTEAHHSQPQEDNQRPLASTGTQLRLAAVSESAAICETSMASADKQNWTSASPTRSKSDSAMATVGYQPITDDADVLVIEDDSSPPPAAPVRRENYRDLFTRLRGG